MGQPSAAPSSALKAMLPSVVTAIGTFCIILARNWAMLAIGWVTLAVVLIGVLVGVVRSRPPEGPVRFRVGPPIAKAASSKRWLVPVGVFVLLLGLAGLLIPAEEAAVPEKYAWSLFLMGAGIASIAIAARNRYGLVAGYALWFAAGVTMTATAIPYGTDSLQIARWLTIGVVMALGGGAAAWSFARNTTRIYEQGIRYGNSLCGWDQIDSWTLREEGPGPLLSLSVAGGKWQPVHYVAPADVTPLREFLSEKTGRTESA